MSPVHVALGSSGILSNLPWFAWVAIIAIVFGCVSGIFSAFFTHKERMAMIRMGMHPDDKRSGAANVEKEYHPEDAEL